MKRESRPEISKELDVKTFKNYYYLKAELVAFCRKEGLQTSGGKLELTQRIACFLQNEKPLINNRQIKKKVRGKIREGDIFETSIIEVNFVCSEKHRKFFRTAIGSGFSFCVPFQAWLKENAGKTYQDAIIAYISIQDEMKKRKSEGKTEIGQQFEYNTYIRDFFANHKDKSLQDAIQCCNYKKGQPGHNRYEETDLIKALKHRAKVPTIL